MEFVQVIGALSALAHGTRLRIYDLLARAGAAGMPAGAIADELKVSPNALSGHLGIMSRAGLISQERQGRSIIYRARPDRLGELQTMLNALGRAR